MRGGRQETSRASVFQHPLGTPWGQPYRSFLPRTREVVKLTAQEMPSQIAQFFAVDPVLESVP